MFGKKSKKHRINITLLVMAMFGVIHLFIFNYLPMFGIVIAFKDMDYKLDIVRALFNSDWVGFDNFKAFLQDRDFFNIMRNTVLLNIIKLIITFPIPILFAIIIADQRSRKFTGIIQTITCFPNFISWVVYGGIVISLFSSSGVINEIFMRIGLYDTAKNFMTEEQYFWWIAIITDVIKGTGWGSVIYISAIAGVDPELYDSAQIDGASRFQRHRYITIPCITGTIVVLLLLAISGILNSNFDQFYILQNDLNSARSEVIDTYVYKLGFSLRRYSYVTAVGLFKSIIAFILLAGSNLVTKKTIGRGIF